MLILFLILFLAILALSLSESRLVHLYHPVAMSALLSLCDWISGEAEEVEVKTGPCAPAGCGQPRLAGCNGPVLAVEWDPPMYDGGANLVAYRVWVRPFSATDADPSDLPFEVFSGTFFWGAKSGFFWDTRISQIPKILQHCIISKGLAESMFPCSSHLFQVIGWKLAM